MQNDSSLLQDWKVCQSQRRCNKWCILQILSKLRWGSFSFCNFGPNQQFHKLKLCKKKVIWLWQDSNLQSSGPMPDALSIRPHNLIWVVMYFWRFHAMQWYGEMNQKCILHIYFTIVAASRQVTHSMKLISCHILKSYCYLRTHIIINWVHTLQQWFNQVKNSISICNCCHWQFSFAHLSHSANLSITLTQLRLYCKVVCWAWAEPAGTPCS